MRLPLASGHKLFRMASPPLLILLISALEELTTSSKFRIYVHDSLLSFHFSALRQYALCELAYKCGADFRRL